MKQQKIKIAALLQTLTAKEQQAFRDFLTKRFKRSEAMLLLYENWLVLFDNAQKADTTYDAEIVWSHLYGNKPFKRTKYDQNNSDLVILLEEFLLIESHKARAFDTEIALMSIYEQRGITEHRFFTAEINAIQEAVKKQEMFSLLQTVQEWIFEARLSRLTTVENTGNFQSSGLVATKLDTLFVLHRLKYLCELNTHIHNRPHEKDLLNNVKLHLASEGAFINWIEKDIDLYNEQPLIAMYYAVYWFISSKNSDIADTNHRKLLLYLENEKNTIAPKEKHELYIYALNYGIKQINNNRSNWDKTVFNLCNTLFTNDYMVGETSVSSGLFTAAIKSCLQSRGATAATQFIEIHKDKLPLITKQQDIGYLKALIYFSQANYKAALAVLPSEKEYKNEYYPLNFRALKFKIYFFLEEGDFNNLARSFEKYLKTNTNGYSDIRVKMHLNAIKYINQMYAIKHRKGKYQNLDSQLINKNLEKILEKVENEPYLVNKNWFYDNIKMLKIKKKKTSSELV